MPYSIYVTIRKSLNSKSRGKDALENLLNESYEFARSDQNLANLKKRCTFLEDANQNLKLQYEDAMADRKADHEHINELETKLENLSKQLDNERLQSDKAADDLFQKARDDRKGLELKHEKTCHENKSLRNENVELEKEIRSLKIALKSSKKEVKDTSHKFEQKMEALDAKNRNLEEFKAVKVSEEKILKTKVKKLDKKLKMLEEREARTKLDKANQIEIERQSNEKKKDANENEVSNEIVVSNIQIKNLFDTFTTESIDDTKHNTKEENEAEPEKSELLTVVGSFSAPTTAPGKSEQNQNFMSAEQEQHFLEEFQKLIKGSSTAGKEDLT